MAGEFLNHRDNQLNQVLNGCLSSFDLEAPCVNLHKKSRGWVGRGGGGGGEGSKSIKFRERIRSLNLVYGYVTGLIKWYLL